MSIWEPRLYSIFSLSLRMAEQFQKILIITAPSGAGKTSITRHLMQKFPQLAFSISAATRPPRRDEEEGRDYYFLSEDAFKEKIKNKEFAEWEMVYEGKYYGTLKTELYRIWANAGIPVLDIDVKGAIHVQQQYPINTLSIFVETPSVEELEKRLKSRGTETDEGIKARINKASYEISFKEQFDKIVVNDSLENACRQAEELVGEFLASDGREIITNH
ncbi:MAG: guanylate kinase [Ferruginibacter sp.]